MAFDQGSPGSESISQINVTPLVDVMLVLLVIFMVTAPILQQGITVHLPQAHTAAMAGEEQGLVVSLTADRTVYLNDAAMSRPDLASKLKALLRERPDRQVFVRADTT